MWWRQTKALLLIICLHACATHSRSGSYVMLLERLLKDDVKLSASDAVRIDDMVQEVRNATQRSGAQLCSTSLCAYS
jgi:hypothetical protein